MRCNENPDGSWKVYAVACLLPDGSKMELNEKRQYGSDEFACIAAADRTVSLQQMVNVNAGCGSHPVGNRYSKSFFLFFVFDFSWH